MFSIFHILRVCCSLFFSLFPPAVMCHSGMLYHQCSSFCKHSCASLSVANICADDCAEGCNCPDGKYFEESVNFCVSM